MSKFKNMPGIAWLVVGVCVTALVMPSVAFAAGALKYTGIEGTSANKADVSPSGQVLTAPASPASYFNGSASDIDEGSPDNSSSSVLYAPPSGDAAVVTSVEGGYYEVGSVTASPNFVYFVSNTACSTATGTLISVFGFVDPTTNGGTSAPVTPGEIVPAGDALCVYANNLNLNASAQGYTIPAADAPASSPSRLNAAGVFDH